MTDETCTKSRRIIFTALAMSLIMTACRYQPDVSESEAIHIAEAQVNAFAVERKIPAKDFRRLRVRVDAETKLWQIDYEHTGKGELLVTILVRNDGSPELTYLAR